jgi:hemolysin D
MVANRYRSDEADFLPAAIALVEQPVSPLPRLSAWLLITFSVCALLWATLGHMDIVAQASGKVVTSGRTKVIQALETAKVRAIHVTEGQEVRAGQTLLELESEIPQADLERSHDELIAMQLQAARAQALQAAMFHHAEPLLQMLDEVTPAQQLQAQNQVRAQYAELQGKLARADAEIARRDTEIALARAHISALAQTLPLLRERAQSYTSLQAEGYLSRNDALEQERLRLAQEGDLIAAGNQLETALAARQESLRARTLTLAESQRAVQDELTEARRKIDQLRPEWAKAQVRRAQTRIVAPVDGSVQQLSLHTIGGVVTPAQQLMLVVPQEKVVIVEATVENRDVGFLHAGQDAEVKVETFQYTKYGTLHGRIARLSQDAINDEKRGPIYSVLIALDKPALEVDGHLVDLRPGMAVSAEIRIGQRRVIEYFLHPLLQHGHESLNEP